ncbi:hypothetical protein QJS10_CPA03g01961 [Acorus calamus]|uniref:Uncharacterized protein n=1 Tax=Acorus calamus TaxID=4465 RepID=A0AAV9F365_ACOCL|nr:hypothetical protein QJS10_CPA03g01961 [Acorus calamus]
MEGPQLDGLDECICRGANKTSEGRTDKGFSVQPLSSERAQEIAKKQEELIGLLRDLPESDYELSLTDLVENDSIDVSVDEGTKIELRSVASQYCGIEGEGNQGEAKCRMIRLFVDIYVVTVYRGYGRNISWFAIPGWVSQGRTDKGFLVQPLSDRAQEIAKKQEELIRLLRDLPESDYELSLTDLVENDSVDVSVDEGKKKVSKAAAKSKKKISRSSSTDGVLLNMFVPLLMTRRLNASRRSPIDQTKRDKNRASIGCFPILWDRGRGKSRRGKVQDDKAFC